MARQFFGQDLARWREPGFGHGPRWRSAAALQRLFSAEMRAAVGDFDPVAELLATLPPEFGRWTPLARDQYLEVRTLLSGYLLSSQGDRMLMAHSVEGRFPFLDREVVALADSLPDGVQAGRPRREARPQTRGARPPAGRYPDEEEAAVPRPGRALVRRAGRARLGGGSDVGAGPGAGGGLRPGVAGQLCRKCVGRRDESQFSNADNMALVGVLSTQLLHESFVGGGVRAVRPATFHTVADRLREGPA